MTTVEDLKRTLETIDPSARIILQVTPQDRDADNGNGTCHGDIVYITVAQVDGEDTLVTLSNCIANQTGDLVFDAPTQFKRFRISTQAGVAAGAADLMEQAACEPTTDLNTHLEVEGMKRAFRGLNDLLGQPGD